ncbi:MAG: hypothetical protein ABIR34_06835 [Marmoricola sp.]
MTAPTATTGSDQKQAGANATQSTDEQRVSFLARAWRTLSAIFGALLGLLPHVLHHTGLIFGAALVTGTGGNLLFGVLGLLFSVPLLRRLYIRFNTWKAPAIALVIFIAMFSLSAFVIGPAISGDSSAETPSPGQTTDHSQHDGH